MITSRISTSTPHSRQYDCPTRAFTPIYKLSHFSSVAQLCPTLCDPKECSTPGLTTEFRVHCTGGEDNGTLLQYSYLGNPMDGGAWWAVVHGVARSWTRLKRLSSSSTGVGDQWLLLPCTDTWASQVALVVKNPPSNVCLKRHRFDPWVGAGRGGRSPEGGNGNPLQYFCLENPMDRGAWWATVHGVAESDITEVTWHACTI